MSKSIGILLVLVALGFAYLGYDDLRWNFAGTGERFSILIERDLELLRDQNALPGAWKQLANVDYHSTTPETEAWLKEAKPTIPTQENGKYNLEVEITDWTEGAQYGGIAQFSLIDKESGNKIWELGRTYKIGPDSSPPEIIED